MRGIVGIRYKYEMMSLGIEREKANGYRDLGAEIQGSFVI